jgi:c-di-GMP-binding flagellar brake protein YcgR
MSMKKSNDTIGNQSRDLPVSSAVPQPQRHRVRRQCKRTKLISRAKYHVSQTVNTEQLQHYTLETWFVSGT